MARPAASLQAKHWKALELFEESILSFKEIARVCKIPLDDIYDLFEGNPAKIGNIAHLFKSEADKITARNAIKIRQLSKDNKKLALYMMNDRLKELRGKKLLKKKESLEITRILNTLAKSTPSVEIGSFSVTKGMSKEELREEFRRLSALARFALDGGRLSSIKAGGSGSLPESSPGGDSVPQE